MKYSPMDRKSWMSNYHPLGWMRDGFRQPVSIHTITIHCMAAAHVHLLNLKPFDLLWTLTFGRKSESAVPFVTNCIVDFCVKASWIWLVSSGIHHFPISCIFVYHVFPGAKLFVAICWKISGIILSLTRFLGVNYSLITCIALHVWQCHSPPNAESFEFFYMLESCSGVRYTFPCSLISVLGLRLGWPGFLVLVNPWLIALHLSQCRIINIASSWRFWKCWSYGQGLGVHLHKCPWVHWVLDLTFCGWVCNRVVVSHSFLDQLTGGWI